MRFLEHLAAAVRIPTVSSIDDVDMGAFDDFRRLLESAYPLTHARLRREIVGRPRLSTWLAGSSG